MNIVDLAWQIIEMKNRILELECEVERLRPYEQKYTKLIMQDITFHRNLVGEIIVSTLETVEKMRNEQ